MKGVVMVNKDSRYLFFTSYFFLFFTIALFSVTFYVYFTNDYMKYREVSVEVIDHYESIGKYSSSCYLIVKSPKWGIFDIPVGPSVFKTFNKGDIGIFKLREIDIHQTSIKNAVYFFGEVILVTCCLAYLFIIVVYYFLAKAGKLM